MDNKLLVILTKKARAIGDHIQIISDDKVSVDISLTSTKGIEVVDYREDRREKDNGKG